MRFRVLGVDIDNVTRRQTIESLDALLRRRDERAVSVFFVNAHTLNLAASDPAYRNVLNASDYVFADGTGVRWAARLQNVRILENMVGTDFVPQMLSELGGHGYSYFMLGGDRLTIEAAADYAERTFPGWRQAGYHHGYLDDEAAQASAVARINAARPDVLLVGMGNPVQECWIRQNLPRLDVRLCMGIGGLFDFWAGNVSRAPAWLRRIGHEWLWRLYQQPALKARRYLIGNPLFLARVLWDSRRHGRKVVSVAER